MWERFTIKRTLLDVAATVTQLETDGNWQYYSQHKEELELVRQNNALRFDGSLMRKAYNSGRLGKGFWK